MVWTFLTISFPGSASEIPKGPQVTVNIYNDAQVPAQVLTQAMQEAKEDFPEDRGRRCVDGMPVTQS
jgi:hypothetical protein